MQTPRGMVLGELAVGARGTVTATVAGGWRSPRAPRPIDAPAIASQPDIGGWLAVMSDDDKRGLVGRLDTQVLLGEHVEVLELNRGWARVRVLSQPVPEDPSGYEVWLPRRQLDRAGEVAFPDVATVTAPTARIALPGAEVELSFGTRLAAETGDGAVVRVIVPGAGIGVLRTADVTVHPIGAPALVPSALSVVATMRRFVGLAYLWAGTSGFGFDCSGLVHLVHRVHGVSLPRDTGPMSQVGDLVDPLDRRAGDLVFFERKGDVHHVVTWLGDGMVIESPRTGLAIREIAFDELPYAHEVSVTRRVVPKPDPGKSGAIPAAPKGTAA